MGDAAYWDNWAGAIGPAPPFSPLPLGEGPGVRVGSSAAARIVECAPRRHPSVDDERASVPRFRGIRTATRGLIAAPWTPASHLLCCAGRADWRRTRAEALRLGD